MTDLLKSVDEYVHREAVRQCRQALDVVRKRVIAALQEELPRALWDTYCEGRHQAGFLSSRGLEVVQGCVMTTEAFVQKPGLGERVLDLFRDRVVRGLVAKATRPARKGTDR